MSVLGGKVEYAGMGGGCKKLTLHKDGGKWKRAKEAEVRKDDKKMKACREMDTGGRACTSRKREARQKRKGEANTDQRRKAS